jgi:uncharacterized membrane protein
MAHAGIWSAIMAEAHWQLPWMQVNFVLAVLPVLGAYTLHRWWRPMGPLRWPLAVAVVLLLPNAPYVVTDLIHLRPSIEWAPSRAAVYAGVVPLFTVLIATGVLSYAYTLHLMRKHMRLAGWSRRRRVGVEVGVSSMCALGVALGRISRLNSWDVFSPSRLAHGLQQVSLDPRSVLLALVIVVVAGVAVDWLASGAAHSLRDRLRGR